MWAALSYSNPLGVWGGAPGSYTKEKPESGVEFVGNAAGIPNVAKSVCTSPFFERQDFGVEANSDDRLGLPERACIGAETRGTKNCRHPVRPRVWALASKNATAQRRRSKCWVPTWSSVLRKTKQYHLMIWRYIIGSFLQFESAYDLL